MFNDKATDQERNFKLRDIITKELEQEARDGDENAIDEIYTDQELNEIIARSEKEEEAFNKMDQDRYTREDREGCIKSIKEQCPR
jgi:hypothetical protein